MVSALGRLRRPPERIDVGLPENFSMRIYDIPVDFQDFQKLYTIHPVPCVDI